MSYKVPHLFFLIAALVLSALRSVFFFGDIDASSGFYEVDSPLHTVFAVALAVAIIALIFMGFFAKLPPDTDRKKYFTRQGGHAAFILGIALFVSAAAFLYRVFFGDLTTLAFPRDGKLTTTLYLACVAVQVISGIYFFLQGRSRNPKNRYFTLLSIASVVWAGLRLFITFLGYATVINSSQNVLELLTLISQLLCYLTLARLLNGNRERACIRRILSLGYSAALLSIVLTVPAFIGCAFGTAIYTVPEMLFRVADMAFAIYIAITNRLLII